MSNRVWLSSLGLACLVVGLTAAPLRAGTPGEPSQGLKEPTLVHKVAPTYPPDAKKEGVEGVVVLNAVIAKDGSVRETSVKQAADNRLVEAARAAVAQWRYEPVRDKKGQVVEATITVNIRFRLDKDKK
jgi:protein TonB